METIRQELLEEIDRHLTKIEKKQDKKFNRLYWMFAVFFSLITLIIGIVLPSTISNTSDISTNAEKISAHDEKLEMMSNIVVEIPTSEDLKVIFETNHNQFKQLIQLLSPGNNKQLLKNLDDNFKIQKKFWENRIKNERSYRLMNTRSSNK